MASLSSLSSALPPAAWLLTSLLLLPISIWTYRLFFHPLARVPGPKLAAVTRQRHVRQLRGNKEFLQGLHKKYGPIVRIGPNQVSLNSEEAFDAIYKAGSAYPKSDWYHIASSGFTIRHLFGRGERKDTLDFLTETNMERYRLQRRLVGTVFSTSNMRKYEDKVSKTLDRVCDRIKRLGGKEVPLGEWMHIIILECVGEITFSLPPPDYLDEGTDFGALDGSLLGMWRWFTIIGLYPKLAVLLHLFPPVIPLIFAYVGLAMPKEMPGMEGSKPILPWVISTLQENVKKAEDADWTPPQDENIFSQLIDVHRAKPEMKMLYVENMTMTNFMAGHDTMTASLVASFARICSQPELQRRVETECREQGVASAFDAQSAGTWTSAAVREAMRLHPVVATNFERKVPAGGASFHGHYLPEDTIVGSCASILHVNPAIFGEDAAEFIPERWLTGDPAHIRKLERVNLVWGGANRSCTGQYMAKLLVGSIIPRLYKEFDVKISSPDDGFENAAPFFLSCLMGHKVRFLSRG